MAITLYWCVLRNTTAHQLLWVVATEQDTPRSRLNLFLLHGKYQFWFFGMGIGGEASWVEEEDITAAAMRYRERGRGLDSAANQPTINL